MHLEIRNTNFLNKNTYYKGINLNICTCDNKFLMQLCIQTKRHNHAYQVIPNYMYQNLCEF